MGAGWGVVVERIAGAGHDEGAVGGMRRQDAMVADQVQARRWGEGSLAADELQRREHQVRGAVVPWGLQGEGQGAVVQLLEAAVGQRRAVDLAAESFQAVAVVGVDGGGGVQGEAAGGKAQRCGTLTRGRIGEQAAQTLAGVRTEGLRALHGGRRQAQPAGTAKAPPAICAAG